MLAVQCLKKYNFGEPGWGGFDMFIWYFMGISSRPAG